MPKKFFTFIIFLFFFLLIPPAFYILQSQSISPAQEKVEYNLPYPGILPDHPLFFLKDTRDKVLEFITRDNLKKAELYLLLSDKRIGMATGMAKNGKDKSAAASFSEAENYYAKIPAYLEASKKQGAEASADLIQRLKLSNAKHREIGQTLLKDLPQGQSDAINKSLNLNQQIKKKIEKL